MILTLDVGNSNIFIGLYNDGQLVNNWRIATDKNKTSDEYGAILMNLFTAAGYGLADVENIIISSVVPSVMRFLKEMTGNYFKANLLTVGPGIKTGINIRTDNPKEVGSDRIVNAVAAKVKYSPPLIIVDFGTATTFDAISKNGDYLGGAILPGIKISQDALFKSAAKLTRVELVKPNRVIAKNTVESVQSGIIYGYAGSVEYIVKKMKKEMGYDVKVIATGGLASLIETESESIDVVDKFLTLDGLKYIYKLNR